MTEFMTCDGCGKLIPFKYYPAEFKAMVGEEEWNKTERRNMFIFCSEKCRRKKK